MKKLAVVLVSALAAGLFFGCSNSSDDNNIGLLLAAGGSNGGSSVSAKLPESVGVNPFVGKSFKNGNTIYSFNSDTFTVTSVQEFPEDSTAGTKAYTYESGGTIKYSYNAETKNIYYSNSGSITKNVYKNADGDQYVPSSSTYYSTEDEYVAIQRKYLKGMSKVTGKTYTEAELEELAKSSLTGLRMELLVFSPGLSGGYTDSTCQTPATPVQIALFNKYVRILAEAQEKTVTCNAYYFDGENLKLSYDGNLPAGIKFGGIYNGTYSFRAVITNSGYPAGSINVNVAEILDPNNTMGAVNFVPSITLSSLGYLKVTSATDDSVTGIFQTRTGSGTIESPYVYTDMAKMTLKLENETTAEKTTVTIKTLKEEGDKTLGTFEIPYKNSISEYTYNTWIKQ